MEEPSPHPAQVGRLRPSAISQFEDHFSGPIIGRDDPGYEDARRVWNGMVDRHPELIVQAASPDDVAIAVRFARDNDLVLAVRGGGHNIAGHGTVDDGLVLDLGRLREIRVDERSRTVTVGAGATLGDIDRATATHGMAVPIGVISGTGIGGLTLGGGVGWLTRAYGLTIDNLRSAHVVTANGKHVFASQAENPDLFWGLRGGGGNFGVVTSFDFQGHPMPAEVLAGNLIYEPQHWRSALTAYAEWTSDLPDEITSILTFLTPPADWDLGDEPRLIIGFAWATGDTRQARDVIGRLRAAAPPDAELTEPVAWPAWQSSVDASFPRGSRGYWKNVSFDTLDEDVVDVLVTRAREQTWVGTAFDIHHLGGTFGRMPEDSTAFPTRSAQFWLNIYGFWTDAHLDPPYRDFVRAVAADMEPFAAGGQYVNFQAEERDADPAQLARDTYGPGKLRRLSEIKAKWDPTNLFRLNRNVQSGQSLR